MTGHALVIGETLVDVVMGPDGTAAHPGGSPANVALGLARLGRSVDLLTRLGEDANGALCAEHLQASGVQIVPGSAGAHATSVATATLDASGAATYDFDIAWDVSTAARLRNAPLAVHTGSIAAVMEPGATTVHRIVSALRYTSTVTYDPNVRPSLMGSPDEARPAIARMVALADVVKASDEDLAWLFPDSTVDDAAREWAHAGPALVVVTRGGEGATAFLHDGREITVKAPAVEVADTVGAGDSFMGGLIDGLWEANLLGRDRRAALRDVDATEVGLILRRCTRIAAITVSRAGANPPTRDELDAD
ncbi:carbohydrate kinase family protein [Demequina silvatica]|uniref:carbohydrate kinase family protein n=1 Tax=Demequina silvatica TaxID=1638988 RepID=UPI0007811E27|nr:carbohydrate kinase [Demequina silvatica]